MSVGWDVDILAQHIGRASVDVDHWPAALEALSRMSGSVGASLFGVTGDASPRLFSPSLGDAMTSYIRDGWVDHDIRYKSEPIIRRKGVATEFDFIAPDVMDRHPYWQEWLKGFGLRWFAGIGVNFGDTLWSLSLQRSIAAGPFLPEEVAVLVRLSGHLSAAGALSSALGNAKLSGALAAFEHAKRAVVLIDWTGAVSGTNDSARKLLGQDLQITNGHIVSVSRAVTAALHAAITQHITGKNLLERAAAIALPRSTGRSIIAHLSSPGPDFGDMIGRCACIITLVDLDEIAALPRTLLKIHFGMTEAEARLAVGVAAGVPLGTLAKNLHVSYETVRTQLRAVFVKAGVSRQAELAALLTSLGERTR